ncbi:cytochrome c biogenesis protein ResB [Abyssicoccus albus]|uniref:Cytochrome c biogenesis protein n=1 Tax=Abyssicoccus albus TaxID=1817405 RepID=A0A1Q1G1A4_9BACL|nr:cytochrome c biogenesis protein ResB [Abyssicoccus albus]AQL56135.1 cytochrome c biogenesis protein ResB [Abyssicoccus albus]RPF58048.1 cytochrome c biogenesis protein [Abyssicoccus albus]
MKDNFKNNEQTSKNDDYIICSCGQKNEPGTQLCISCGRMINEDYDKKKIQDVMRYDGSAVRSKVRNKTIIDKIWNWFASIKVGVTLIALTAIAAAIGTIFPQQYFIPVGVDPSIYYKENYGALGELYYQLGFHNLYSSWWFIVLLALIALSIIAASIDRGVPLFKSLSNQRVKKHPSFYSRQKINESFPAKNLNLKDVESQLKLQRYKTRQDQGHILAEKGRFSRYGPYINHSGLIILLIGSMLRFFPGMYVDELMYIKEGDRKPVPSTNREYYVENKKFTAENYDASDGEAFQQAIEKSQGMIAKNYQTDLTLYKNTSAMLGESDELKKVDEGSIRLNHPFKFDDYHLYQSSYDQSQMKTMTFKLIEKSSQKQIGQPFEVNLDNPKEHYTINDQISIDIKSYVPDFKEISSQGSLVSKSPNTINPAFVFDLNEKGEESEYSFIKIKEAKEISEGNHYEIKFDGMTNHMATILTVKKDKTLPFIFTGFIIFLIGVFIGSYVNHRRIWLNISDDGQTLNLAAHTNKNYFGLNKDIEKMATQLSLHKGVENNVDD